MNFKSLIQLLDYFKDEETCIEYYERIRWGMSQLVPIVVVLIHTRQIEVGNVVTKNVTKSLLLRSEPYLKILKYLSVFGLLLSTWQLPVKKVSAAFNLQHS